MAMWAGVQKVSRPMLRCQETSQAPPMLADVTARTPHQTYQGTEAGRANCSGWAEVDIVLAGLRLAPEDMILGLIVSRYVTWQTMVRCGSLLHGQRSLTTQLSTDGTAG